MDSIATSKTLLRRNATEKWHEVSRASAARALARAERDPGPSGRLAKRIIGLAAQHREPVVCPGSRLSLAQKRSLVRDKGAVHPACSRRSNAAATISARPGVV